MKKILISTGGSGGHVMPALNLYEHLKKDFNVKIYTDSRGAKFFPKEINKTIFDVKQVPEKKYLLPIKLIFILYSFLKSIFLLKKKEFDIIFSTGGYMSFPIVLAAKVFNKKIFLFEPNSIIGRSNKLLLKFATKIICYDKNLKGIHKKYSHKLIEIAPILNKCFYEKNTSSETNENFLKILIMGGSQASLFFTKYLKNEILQLSKKYKVKVTQQLSKGFDLNNYKKEYINNNIESNLFFFEENFLCKNYKFDIAISRSGASSLAELAHLNIPFIAIPFPYATDNHQFINAKRYQDLNCCWILEEKNFNSGDIYKIINQFKNNKNEYIEKKKNLIRYSENNNWKNINKILIRFLNEN